MSSPLPCEPTPVGPSVPSAHPDRRPALTIVSAPDCEPPFDPDPFWSRPRLRPVPDAVYPPTDAADPPTPECPAPGPSGAALAARRLVAGYLDALHGRRPVGQLLRLATEDGAGHLRRALSAPISPRRRIRLQSLHVAEPMPGVAEAVAILTEADVSWAVTLRLEHHDAWRCAWLEPIEPARSSVPAHPPRPASRRR